MGATYPATRLVKLWRSPIRRVTVRGESMRPGLEPGDRLVVVGLLRGRPGDVVAVVDPRTDRRTGGRVLVKRVAAVDPGDGRVTVLGDNPGASTDSRTFGPVRPERVLGRAVYRYWPEQRRGRLQA